MIKETFVDQNTTKVAIEIPDVERKRFSELLALLACDVAVKCNDVAVTSIAVDKTCTRFDIITKELAVSVILSKLM